MITLEPEILFDDEPTGLEHIYFDGDIVGELYHRTGTPYSVIFYGPGWSWTDTRGVAKYFRTRKDALQHVSKVLKGTENGRRRRRPRRRHTMSLGSKLRASRRALNGHRKPSKRRAKRNPGRYTLREIKSMPTIHSGQFDNLKYDDGKTRVWLSRMTVADGMPYNNQVTIEKLRRGRWEIVEQYRPR